MISTTTFADLYAEVLQYYARQMQQLDAGDFEAYGTTFTENGEFRHTPFREPARSRAGIVRELHEFHQMRFAGTKVQRRHWFNMIDVDPQADGSIDVTCYALVITTLPGGKPELAPSCVVRDVLVREDDGMLRNRSRRVEHDQIDESQSAG